MKKAIYLREFNDDELLFNAQDTALILKFIFEPKDHSKINTLDIDNHFRGFAQGLLLEAIDASYAIGFTEILVQSLYGKGKMLRPKGGVRKIIKQFARKASMHWFKHATASDLSDIKIYDFVSKELARRFRSTLISMISGVLPQEKSMTVVDYRPTRDADQTIWS